MKRITLAEDQARLIMDRGDIPEEMRGISPRVAVILTQGWCPQWRAMNSYLSRLEMEEPLSDNGLTVYELIYDRLPFFFDFLRFKETTYKNEHIPYVRFYVGGEFVGASNYLSEPDFLAMLRV